MRHFGLIQPWPTLLTPNLLRPRTPRPVGLVSRSINTILFADGACEGRSRSEEEAMQGHRVVVASRTRRRRARHKRHRIYGTRHLPTAPTAFVPTPSEPQALACGQPQNRYLQRGASSFPILANSDLRRWTGPATTRTECSGETYFRTAFWKISGVTRSRRNP